MDKTNPAVYTLAQKKIIYTINYDTILGGYSSGI